MKYILILIVIMILTGCTMVKYEDVSHQKKYSKIVGKTYKTLIPLVIHGVTRDSNYKKQIDIYTVTKLPGSSGPEIIFKNNLNAGIYFKIDKIKQCTNCLKFTPSISFIIDISKKKYGNIPIRIVDFSIKDENGNLIMDPIILEKID